jgi:hypothetical protein
VRVWCGDGVDGGDEHGSSGFPGRLGSCTKLGRSYGWSLSSQSVPCTADIIILLFLCERAAGSPSATILRCDSLLSY